MEKISLNRIALFCLTVTMIIVAVIGLRMFTVYPYSAVLYGYDYGFYAYAIRHTDLNSLSYFLGLSSNYGTHLFVIFNWLRLPQIPSLVISYYALQAGSAIVLFYILRRRSKLAALLGVFLFCFSVAQTQLHVMFLWKAAYGQLLMLAGFYLIETKRYKWLALSSLVLFITHTTTSLIYSVSLAVYGIGLYYKNWRVLAIIFCASLLILTGFVYHIGYQAILNLFHPLANPAMGQGVFLSLIEYFRYSWIILPFSAYGIYHAAKHKRDWLWLSLMLVAVVWIVIELPFYNRVLQYLDLSLIYFAALGGAAIGQAQAKIYKTIAVIILCCVTIIGWWFFIHTLAPQINPTEVNEIQVFSIGHQNAFVLAVSAEDGPWLLSNLFGNIRLAAPGIFEDPHSYDDWINFWQSPQQIDFLEKFPAPLYIYQRSSIVFTENWACLHQITDHFYQFICL